jgi:hypothetical protein
MNLRVLIYSNPLVVDKIGKTFQFQKDSGFIYTKQLVKSLPANWRYYWLIPDKIRSYEDQKWFYDANRFVELISYPYSTSIHQNRYNFSVNTLSSYFDYGNDIDVVLCHQPEVAANLRVWFQNQRRETPLIFSYYHWIDCKESAKFGKELSGYSSRQLDGADASDYIMFHNQYAYELFMAQAYSNHNFPYVDNCTLEKSRFFHPTATIFPEEPFETGVPQDKKIILFNHRLNNTTQWKEVVEVTDEIYKERQDFVLWITDDSKLKEFEYLKARPYIKVQSLNDREYGYILKKAHFSVCNHRGYSTWNMAVLDSFANLCLVLIPNREVYQRMFLNSIDQCKDKFTHNGNLKEMIEKLLDNSREYNRELAGAIFDRERYLFLFNQAESVQKLIEEHMDGSDIKPPAKYDEIVAMIKENRQCTKKEIVNKFWSFHVNSNFPIIRKKLLAEKGIMDDTAGSQTTYHYLED